MGLPWFRFDRSVKSDPLVDNDNDAFRLVCEILFLAADRDGTLPIGDARPDRLGPRANISAVRCQRILNELEASGVISRSELELNCNCQPLAFTHFLNERRRKRESRTREIIDESAPVSADTARTRRGHGADVPLTRARPNSDHDHDYNSELTDSAAPLAAHTPTENKKTRDAKIRDVWNAHAATRGAATWGHGAASDKVRSKLLDRLMAEHGVNAPLEVIARICACDFWLGAETLHNGPSPRASPDQAFRLSVATPLLEGGKYRVDAKRLAVVRAELGLAPIASANGTPLRTWEPATSEQKAAHAAAIAAEGGRL